MLKSSNVVCSVTEISDRTGRSGVIVRHRLGGVRSARRPRASERVISTVRESVSPVAHRVYTAVTAKRQLSSRENLTDNADGTSE